MHVHFPERHTAYLLEIKCLAASASKKRKRLSYSSSVSSSGSRSAGTRRSLNQPFLQFRTSFRKLCRGNAQGQGAKAQQSRGCPGSMCRSVLIDIICLQLWHCTGGGSSQPPSHHADKLAEMPWTRPFLCGLCMLNLVMILRQTLCNQSQMYCCHCAAHCEGRSSTGLPGSLGSRLLVQIHRQKKPPVSHGVAAASDRWCNERTKAIHLFYYAIMSAATEVCNGLANQATAQTCCIE